MAPLEVLHYRWILSAAWKRATALEEPGLAPKPAGPVGAGAWGEPQEVVSKAAVVPKMCTHA